MKDVRKKHGLTQKQLAKKVGVSRGLISLVELGIIHPYPSLRHRIAKVLGTREADLFSG
jgi:transcriptional regulator with XRE-family HTH domain